MSEQGWNRVGEGLSRVGVGLRGGCISDECTLNFLYYCKWYDNDSMKCRFGWRHARGPRGDRVHHDPGGEQREAGKEV